MSSLLTELSGTVSSEHSSLDQCRDLLSTVTDMQVTMEFTHHVRLEAHRQHF